MNRGPSYLDGQSKAVTVQDSGELSESTAAGGCSGESRSTEL